MRISFCCCIIPALVAREKSERFVDFWWWGVGDDMAKEQCERGTYFRTFDRVSTLLCIW
jgi:hypothetical protein